jgi:hypothetical protein
MNILYIFPTLLLLSVFIFNVSPSPNSTKHNKPPLNLENSVLNPSLIPIIRKIYSEVIIMGLFSSIYTWKQASDERRITKMKAQGSCPACNGRGFNPMFTGFVGYSTYVDQCHGCNGSGLFSVWAETNHQEQV